MSKGSGNRTSNYRAYWDRYPSSMGKDKNASKSKVKK